MPMESMTVSRQQLSCLSPEDLAWACWFPLSPPQERPVRPFNRDKLIAEIKASKEWPDSWIEATSKGIHPLEMSREEASFWLYAAAFFCQEGSVLYCRDAEAEEKIRALLISKLQQDEYKILVHHPENLPAFIQAHLKSKYKLEPEWLTFVLAPLLEPKEIVELASKRSMRWCYTIMRNLRAWVLPHRTDRQLNECRQFVQEKLDASKIFDESSDMGQWYVIACFLGMSDEVLSMVETLNDDALLEYDNDYVLGHLYAVSLPSRELVQKHFRRLGFTLDCPTYRFYDYEFDMMKAWLANCGIEGIDLVGERVVEFSRDDYVKLLLGIEAPQVVPFVIRLTEKSKESYMAARTWLQAHADWAAPELLARSKSGGKPGAAARALLGTIRTSLNPDLCPPEVVKEIEQMFSSATDSLPELDQTTTPDWLKKALTTDEPKGKKVAMPPWLVDIATLPSIVVEGKRMNSEQMTRVLLALKQSDLDTMHPLVHALRENVARSSTEILAWSLFELWEQSQSPPKDKWAMQSLALLGGDLTVSKLAALVREWPGQSQHKKAVTGLECLRKIGSLTALMYISALATKLKFPALKSKAQECMEQIAAERGLTRAELEDRAVPDCELDERGNRNFDFGKRQFAFTLGADLKPMLRYPDGSVKNDLPKANSSDTPEMVQASVAQWKVVKVQVKDTAKLQAVRLEQAMIIGRRWSLDDFQQLLVQHPLMIHLIRSLVCGAYENGALVSSFRVCEDRTFADVDDRIVNTSGDALIGIVHPLNLSPELRTRWRAVIMEDYQLFPSIQQMDRPVMALTEDENTRDRITRYSGNKVPAITLLSALEKRGWLRGDVGDGGSLCEHTKYFPGMDVSAIVNYTGVSVTSVLYDDDQSIECCYFLKGDVNAVRYNRQKWLRLTDVDPIVISEVLADCTAATISKERGN